MKENSNNIKKSLGQHYLTNMRVLEKIAALIAGNPENAFNKTGALSETTVVEIGAGTGWLTKILLQNSKQVIAIEIEAASTVLLARNCSEKGLPHPRLKIVNKDAMTIDFGQLLAAQVANAPAISPSFIVCGNLPYNISARLILDMLESFSTAEIKPKKMVFLIQKEVAERFAFFSNEAFSFRKLPNTTGKKATKRRFKGGVGKKRVGGKNGVAGVSSYLAVWHAHAKQLLHVSPGNFSPPPKVDSSLVQFTPCAKPAGNAQHYQLYKFLIKVAFSQRRKQSGALLLQALGNKTKLNTTPTFEFTAMQLARGKKFLQKKQLSACRADQWHPYHYGLLARFLMAPPS